MRSRVAEEGRALDGALSDVLKALRQAASLCRSKETRDVGRKITHLYSEVERLQAESVKSHAPGEDTDLLPEDLHSERARARREAARKEVKHG